MICRVETCQKPLKRQNYSRHLKTIHKEENCNDLRVYGQPKFSWNPRANTAKGNDDTVTVEVGTNREKGRSDGEEAGVGDEVDEEPDLTGDEDIRDNDAVDMEEKDDFEAD